MVVMPLGAADYAQPGASGPRLVDVMGTGPSSSAEVQHISTGVGFALPSPESGPELDL